MQMCVSGTAIMISIELASGSSEPVWGTVKF